MAITPAIKQAIVKKEQILVSIASSQGHFSVASCVPNASNMWAVGVYRIDADDIGRILAEMNSTFPSSQCGHFNQEHGTILKLWKTPRYSLKLAAMTQPIFAV